MPGAVEQIQFRMTLLPRESSGRAPATGGTAHLTPVVRPGPAAARE